jgi:hypothetical protein
MEVEAIKQKLLRVSKEDVEKLQGAAGVWQEIINIIERDPSRVDKPIKPAV